MSLIWNFVQDQLLGMKWLNAAIGRILTALSIDVSTRLGGSIQFFLYDVIKITIHDVMYRGWITPKNITS